MDSLRSRVSVMRGRKEGSCQHGLERQPDSLSDWLPNCRRSGLKDKIERCGRAKEKSIQPPHGIARRQQLGDPLIWPGPSILQKD